MAWFYANQTYVPRDDGSSTNDWITEPIDLPSSGRDVADWPDGQRRSLLVRVKLEVYSGSGSNTWLVKPVVVAQPERPPDYWNVFPAPPAAAAVAVGPVYFSQADLPLQKIFSVPLKLCQYALQFTRSGGGTNVLKWTLWTDGCDVLHFGASR